jgi:hypothetical protein
MIGPDRRLAHLIWRRGRSQGEGTQPPLTAPLPEQSSVMISYGELTAPLPLTPPPLTLLASCEISDIQTNHIICPRLYCCQLLTETTSQSSRGKGVYHTQYTFTVHTYSGPCWVLWQNLRPVAHNQEKANTIPSSIFLHIIGRSPLFANVQGFHLGSVLWFAHAVSLSHPQPYRELLTHK